MNFFKKIFGSKLNSKKYVYYKYPYSNEIHDQRSSLIQNLTKGILLEDSDVFISWDTTYNQLNNYATQVNKKGDRTIYEFGVHKILNGLELKLSAMKWVHTSGNVSFGSVEAALGQDETGRSNANKIKDHITKLLGVPNSKNEVDEWEMTVEWVFAKSKISIVGWSHFAVKYDIKVGLVHEPNWLFMK